MNLSESPLPHDEDPRVRRIELLISNLLRVGVIVSLCVIVFGIVLMFIQRPEMLSSAEALRQMTETNAVFPHTISAVVVGLMAFSGEAITVLGLLLLVATPVARVAISIFAFLYQKDRVFVVITSVVLMLLLLSFMLGKAGG